MSTRNVVRIHLSIFLLIILLGDHTAALQLNKNVQIPEQPTVYFTFDDGPSRLTGDVLDILAAEDVPATFFVLGSLAEKQHDLIRRIVDEGHQLGNHTYDHHYPSLYENGFHDFWQQVAKTDEILYSLTGIRTPLLRAPGGTHRNFDAVYFDLLEQAGYLVHDWNIDSGDARRRAVPAKEIVENVKAGPFPHEVVLLMHDSSGHEESVKALPEIIQIFRNKGYQFATLTADVKPIQHSLGPLKWSERKYSEQKMAELLKLIENESVLREIQVASLESNLQEPSLPVPALHLVSPASNMEWEPEHYLFEQDRFYLSLREWSERTGATVEWKADQRTAVIRHGFYTQEYKPDEQIVETSRLGRVEQKTRIQLEMKIEDGSIYVPLRDLFSVFGLEVTEYTVSPEEREVHFYQTLPIHHFYYNS